METRYLHTKIYSFYGVFTDFVTDTETAAFFVLVAKPQNKLFSKNVRDKFYGNWFTRNRRRLAYIIVWVFGLQK